MPVVAFCASAWLTATTIASLGSPWWVNVTVSVVAMLCTALCVLDNFSAEARHDAMIKRCSELQGQLECDPLTGLMNRSAFNKALTNLRANVSESVEVMVLFFDLDRFKDVNDSLGHRAGDQLLVEVANRAGTVLSDATAFARLGGDEFAALVPLKGSVRPQHYGELIVELINEPFDIDHHRVSVAASVGIATGDPFVDEGHELLRRADAAMYAAKGAARGSCRIFDEKLSGRQVRETSIRSELGTCLAEGGLKLVYQPLIDARTGVLSSAEALLRASSPGLANVDTATLISIAEKSGQIIELTEWTMDAVFSAIRELESTPVALNISPVYFRQPQFVHKIIDRLLESDTPPDLLTIEVTEGVLIADMVAARESIAQLREIGVKLYLDDFGTCYSSMSYLQHLELDGLKLDKTFLRNIGDHKKTSQIIKAMIDFGHSLDMRVVMEGVESEWQVRLLQLLNCDLLQGYELGAPMELAELRALRDRVYLPAPQHQPSAGRPLKRGNL
ncbi:MAG TPA: EAL domain-containing protein [Sphingomicrobium sp.]|nr:EAL domain-containing protein [Sphingomicrobium sp.]